MTRIVAAAFYLFGLIFGILLISQFWTIANDIYDARQAKRLFGLIGARQQPGRRDGRRPDAALVQPLGANPMLLLSAASSHSAW